MQVTHCVDIGFSSERCLKSQGLLASLPVSKRTSTHALGFQLPQRSHFDFLAFYFICFKINKQNKKQIPPLVLVRLLGLALKALSAKHDDPDLTSWTHMVGEH